jgi:ankyrin repeat protein
MSLMLSTEAKAELQQKYFYLTNYESDDPTDPIDPLTYVDSNGDSLLHIAAQNGDAKTIELLLDAGIDIDQLGDMESTALHYAYQGGHRQAIEVLLNRGATTGIRNLFGKAPGE